MNNIFTTLAGFGILFAVILFWVGLMHWFWLALNTSFLMFALSFLPPVTFIGAITGAYALFFGWPVWVYNLFG